MDCPSHAVVSDEGDLAWSDSRSVSSDEGVQDGILDMQRSPSPIEPEAWLNPTSTTRLQTGQLSPISTGMDIPPALDGSSAPNVIDSAPSSCTDDWSIGYGDEADPDIHWEQGSDDILTVPKLEPLDDDFNLDDVKEAPPTPGQQSNEAPAVAAPKQKRPRGRPRKHPLTPVIATNKVTKGRSKTGCITCRKRKKKCDEAKPRCMNCEKNAVVCEGYHEKQIWRSGKEKAEEDRLRRESLPAISMPAIFHAVETTEDRIFWKHYCLHLSNVLTVEGEAKNAFKDIILNLANQHQGLMHSILSVSSKHIDYDTPYGMKLLQDNPATSLEQLQQRANYHHEEAMKRFYQDIQQMPLLDHERRTILSARYGQMMCMLIGTLAEGNPRGEHRYHLDAYKKLIHEAPPEDPSFLMFITEFFQYHIYADELIWHPDMHIKRVASEDWSPPVQIHPPRLLGVADGLFGYLTKITSLRNKIRANITAGEDPSVDYNSLFIAQQIEEGLHAWQPHWPQGDSRERVGLLYKQMMWVYLYRTIYPPYAFGLVLSASSLPSHDTSHAPSPPRRDSMSEHFGSSCQSSPSLGPIHDSSRPHLVSINSHSSESYLDSDSHHDSESAVGSRQPSRTNSMHSNIPLSPTTTAAHGSPQQGPHTHQQFQDEAHSPPPIRRPEYHDRRVADPVERALAILESFKPSDPAQTLLLIPCLIVGTACFNPEEQERIRQAIRAVRGYTGLRNCDRVRELLEEIWRRMDRGDWVAVWDWQGVARQQGLDFLCT